MKLPILPTTIVLLFGLSAFGCGEAGKEAAAASGAAASAKPQAPSGKGSSPSAAPSGPAFRTKAMGVDMVQALVERDLVAPLAGMTIVAPEKTEIEESRGAVKLTAAGVNYSITIREQKFDKAKSIEIFKVLDEKGAVVDESESHVIFKRENGSHLLSASVTADGKSYVCNSVATAKSFTREEIDQTLTSCRTLKKKG